MKKFVVLVGLVLCYFASLSAQMPAQELPIDPKVRYGVLENGLTYYIRHNEQPKERADFYIAQKVGSMQEEDNQAGLAHFLEHMAFNGSKNFPENGVIKYLETIGVKFGENLNAYTSFDETVYNISNVPVIREGIIDSCLLILHDWSSGLSLEEKDIEKERGVIREEMRSYNEAYLRQIEKLLPMVMPGNKYAKRMPIGTEEVIENFKPEELRAYYHKWYRPDLQGIMIVGDIDVDQIESKIKAIFADVPAPVDPAERIYYEVEGNEKPLVGIATDKESTFSIFSIDFKHKPLPKELKGTIAGLLVDYFNTIASSITNERLRDLTQQANPPFIQAGSGNGDFLVCVTEEAWGGYTIVKDNEVETALRALTREMERVNRYGFTTSEYERAKSNYLTNLENAFNERDKVLNGQYSRKYAGHFTRGGYIPGVEMEYNILNAMAPQIPVEVINQYIQELMGDSNIVITLLLPEKEGVVIPTNDQLLTWFNEVRNEEIQAFEDKVSDEPLMTELPKGGEIVKETKDDIFGTINYTLSNGVKVVIKPTTFKDDDIMLSATSPGGSSLFPEDDVVNIKLYNEVCDLGGVGNFSKTDLPKVLAGKKASVSPTIELVSEGFAGSSSIKDFETMLQLVYLHFTAPRIDEEAYQSFISRRKSLLESSEANPQIALVDTLQKEIYVNLARISRMRASDLDKANYQTIMNWRNDRYKDASDFTFIFVGSIDPEATKDLIAQYLGALPSINRKEAFKPVNLDFHKGINKNHFDKTVENPKSTVLDLYWGNTKFDLEHVVKMDMLQQILTILYQEKVREDEGGTYGVSVSGGIDDYPKGRSYLQIYFETDASKKDYLNEIIHNEFNNLIKEGPRPEDFQKTKEFMLKKQQENEEDNGYWNGAIHNFYKTGFNRYTDYVKTVNAVTPEDIRQTAKSLLDNNNLIEVIMTGVK